MSWHRWHRSDWSRMEPRSNVTVRLAKAEKDALSSALPLHWESADISQYRPQDRSLSAFFRFAAEKYAGELKRGAAAAAEVDNALRSAGETQVDSAAATIEQLDSGNEAKRHASAIASAGRSTSRSAGRSSSSPKAGRSGRPKRKAAQRPLKLGRTRRKGKPAKGKLWSKVDRLAKKRRARR